MEKQNNTLALKVEKLAVAFNGRSLFSDFSFEVFKGEHILVSGDSGSGKSTVLKCLLGFVQPVKGAVYILGDELTPRSVWRLRSRIGFVQQEPEFKQSKVEQILMRPFQFKANGELSYDYEKVKELFSIFRLPERLIKEDVSDLSGGEKQRVALVAAMLLRRDIYLLDEATSALDRESKKAALDYLASLRDITIISVTHDAAVSEAADRVIQLGQNS